MSLSESSLSRLNSHIIIKDFLSWWHLVIGNPFDVNFIIFRSTDNSVIEWWWNCSSVNMCENSVARAWDLEKIWVPIGFEPMTSRTPGGRSIHWATRTHREQAHSSSELVLILAVRETSATYELSLMTLLSMSCRDKLRLDGPLGSCADLDNLLALSETLFRNTTYWKHFYAGYIC